LHLGCGWLMWTDSRMVSSASFYIYGPGGLPVEQMTSGGTVTYLYDHSNPPRAPFPIGKPNLPVAHQQLERELSTRLVESVANPEASCCRSAGRPDGLPSPEVIHKHFNNDPMRGHDAKHPPIEHDGPGG